jgi:hypothetical protein
MGVLLGSTAADFRAAQRVLVIEGGMFLRVEGQWVDAVALAYPGPAASERSVSLQIVCAVRILLQKYQMREAQSIRPTQLSSV